MTLQGVSAALFVLSLLNACSNTQTLPDGTTVTCQPIYGNWCGKGYPADAYMKSATPVDDWDRACRAHDYCYDAAKDSDAAIDRCDRKFADTLEDIARRGVPVPRQISNAYNVFRDNLPYRNVFISFSDLFNANTLDCRGIEGQAARFCGCGSYWYQIDGNSCVCQGQPIFHPYYGWIPNQSRGREVSTNDW